MNQLKDNVQVFLIIWAIILFLNQIVFFGSCFAFSCLIAAMPHTLIITFLIFLYLGSNSFSSKIRNLSTEINEPKSKNTPIFQNLQSKYLESEDPLKKKGDEYERYIGKELEKNDNLVIYNGLIRGYEDGGIDLIAISYKSKTINLIQCKHWNKMSLTLERIEEINEKLSKDNFDFLLLPSSHISNHLQFNKLCLFEIEDILQNMQKNLKNFTIYKTLYIASKEVFDLTVADHLTMIRANIFRYKDMKIVIETKK